MLNSRAIGCHSGQFLSFTLKHLSRAMTVALHSLIGSGMQKWTKQNILGTICCIDVKLEQGISCTLKQLTNRLEAV